ncbi:Uncharacterised protein [BD1-7 clade bacterium]|uniref:Uncharacterized protein n=1 Tax=BD1-7 clade bacterium TaxID=2029982 RepID=A0A5S9QW40_9GAMM|nr:Uncharacterised protein [BD1-7 clade bacterium]
MFPTSRVGKIVFAVWLSICIGLLIFAYIQREIHDMPVAFTWLLMLVSAPIGFVIGPVVGVVTANISDLFNIPYQPFFSLLPSWFIVVAVGYLQWFIAIPRFIKWCRSKWSGT